MCKNEFYLQALKLATEWEGDLSPDRQKIISDLLEKAYEQGSGDAASAIANWIHFGIFYERDPKRETELVKFAAKKGNTDSLFSLATKYEAGVSQVLRKNEQTAFALYLEAALRGEADAYFELWRCFYWGIGVSRNRSAAKICRLFGREKGGALRKR